MHSIASNDDCSSCESPDGEPSCHFLGGISHLVLVTCVLRMAPVRVFDLERAVLDIEVLPQTFREVI